MQQYHQQAPAVPVHPQQYQQPTAVPHVPVPAAAHLPGKKRTLRDKVSSKTFSTLVKALCILLLLAAFLPFGTISCAGQTQSVNGYQLAFGGAQEQVDQFTQSGASLGMGMGAGQLAALNLLAGTNSLLVVAFVGTALLLLVSLVMGQTRLEIAFAIALSTFSIAAFLQWLALFSAFTGMFEHAQGTIPMSAGPDIGLYLVILLAIALLVFSLLQAVGKLPAFLTKGEEQGDIAAATAVSAGPFTSHYAPPVAMQPGYYVAQQQVQPVQPVQPVQQVQAVRPVTEAVPVPAPAPTGPESAAAAGPAETAEAADLEVPAQQPAP